MPKSNKPAELVSHPSRSLRTLTVPADYLPEARVALMEQISNDGDWVKSVASGTLEDLEYAMKSLNGDMRLHKQLQDAQTDTELKDDPSGPLESLLEGIIRKAVGYLQDEIEYGPLSRADIREHVDRVRWALTELDRYHDHEVEDAGLRAA